MCEPISKELLQERVRREIALNETEAIIIDRIRYVLERIYACFGRKLKCWWFPDAGEGEMGSLNKALRYGESVTYENDCNLNEDTILLKNGGEYGLGFEFPVDWLYENFEKELVDGRAAYLKKKVDMAANEKARKEQAKTAADKLKASARKKLTPEERKALGIK